MTIKIARQILLNFFRTNDYFDLEKDFLKIVTLTETPEADKAAIQVALELLAQTGSICRGGSHWILTQPLKDASQTVEIGSEICEGIAHAIGQLHEIDDEEFSECDPYNICEQDIISLLVFNDILMNQVNQLNKEKEGEPAKIPIKVTEKKSKKPNHLSTAQNVK